MITKKSPKSFVALRAAIALAALAATSGCFLVAVGAAGAAGAGTVAYVRGELDASLGSPYDPVVRAAEAAVQQLQFVTVKETKDAFTAEIVARTAEDKKVDVVVSREADNLTQVKIRIGVFGNEEMSRAVLDKLKQGL
jgi:hypothetical protein